MAAAQLQTAPIAKLARIKYAVRARLSEKGYKGKHKRLENTLCLHVLQIWKEAGGNDNPDLVVRELGYDSIEDYFDVLSTSIDHGMATLFDIAQAKYGNPLAPEQLRANFRPIRPLTGPSSQAARLFGLEGTQYAPSAVYRDNGQPKQTDVAQFEAALQNYDHDPSHAQTIELILNTAAFYWQLAILNALHTPSSERMLLEALLVNQIQSIEKELAARGIDSRLLEQSAKLVFSSRLLVEKNKPLERKLIGKLLTSEN